MKRILLPLAVIFVLVMACSDLWGQATAQISGSARDQSGAVLPGVEIKATQTEKGRRVRNDRIIGQAIPKETPPEFRKMELEKRTWGTSKRRAASST